MPRGDCSCEATGSCYECIVPFCDICDDPPHYATKECAFCRKNLCDAAAIANDENTSYGVDSNGQNLCPKARAGGNIDIRVIHGGYHVCLPIFNIFLSALRNSATFAYEEQYGSNIYRGYKSNCS